MPYYDPSWRADRPGLRWLSRLLCVVLVHHWLKSRRSGRRLLCVVCEKKTKDWTDYSRNFFQK